MISHTVGTVKLLKNMSRWPKISTFFSGGGPSSCHSGEQPLSFQQMILIKIFKAQNCVSRSQNGSLTTKAVQICPKSIKNIPKNCILFSSGADSTVVT